MREFGFWCQKVLPLVYDESLSYYEVLCKVRDKLNELIKQDEVFGEALRQLEKELAEVNQWIANFDTEFVKGLVEKYVATMIFVGISDAGYIFYDMPESWDDIQFRTTGLDVDVASMPEYGHLVLSY